MIIMWPQATQMTLTVCLLRGETDKKKMAEEMRYVELVG